MVANGNETLEDHGIWTTSFKWDPEFRMFLARSVNLCLSTALVFCMAMTVLSEKNICRVFEPRSHQGNFVATWTTSHGHTGDATLHHQQCWIQLATACDFLRKSNCEINSFIQSGFQKVYFQVKDEAEKTVWVTENINVRMQIKILWQTPTL